MLFGYLHLSQVPMCPQAYPGQSQSRLVWLVWLVWLARVVQLVSLVWLVPPEKWSNSCVILEV